MRLFDQTARNDRRRSETHQHSHALANLVPSPQEIERKGFSVLDLGRASPANLDFFGSRGARITISDFYRALAPIRAKAAVTRESMSELLCGRPDSRFDLILAWDVLNYLTRFELGLLAASLYPHVRSGTAIHAFIATGREMATSPSYYRIENASTLAVGGAEGRKIPAPRYIEPELVKLIPGLTVEHRVQLRNEMLEYAFSYRLGQAESRPSTNAGVPRYRSAPAIGWSGAPSR